MQSCTSNEIFLGCCRRWREPDIFLFFLDEVIDFVLGSSALLEPGRSGRWGLMQAQWPNEGLLFVFQHSDHDRHSSNVPRELVEHLG